MRFRDLSGIEKGEEIDVIFRPSPMSEAESIRGTLEVRYTDMKVGIKRENGDIVICNLRDPCEEDTIYLLESDEVLGRGLCAERVEE